MPDQEPGDVFLRHRSLVLAALMPDSPGAEADAPGAEADAQPADAEPAKPDPETTTQATQRLMESDTVPESRPLSGVVDVGTATRPRRSGNSSASDRINALLNGSTATASSPPTFVEPPRSAYNGGATAPADPAPEHRDEFDDLLRRPRQEGLRGKAAEWGQRLVPALRKPKVQLAVGAALVVLLLIVLIRPGGGEPPEQPLVMTVPQTPAPTSAANTAAADSAKRIQVLSAKSHCPAGSTDPMDAFSSEADKAWACVRAYKVDGQVLTIDLGASHKIESISLVPGWDYVSDSGVDEWDKHRTASKVSYQFDDANFTTYTQETLDQRGVVTTEINPPVTATKITLTILKSGGDRALTDTAISSIVITGQ
ncbi:discoidin domain-containing protein [Nocardia uniformis]|uniref:Discoidin domain-containing protein n=1 Tax=Nocardia uniformis TaxID=53432 RepID=A0A849C3F6_9NOCA|nr:discoidin domain-containing protein [Nocardia uniformis]NNH73224.1 discoidin domain-containing protein [Nocardia uniformis]